METSIGYLLHITFWFGSTVNVLVFDNLANVFVLL